MENQGTRLPCRTDAHNPQICSLLRIPVRLVFLLALLLPAYSLPPKSLLTQENPLQVIECMNTMHISQGTTWAGAMSDKEHASLKAIGAWWSDKPLRIPLTIVTQLSANRVTQLWAQCKSWPGPLSAAVHLTIQQPTAASLTPQSVQLIKRTLKAVSDFHLSIEKDPSACRLDLVLVYEVYTEPAATILYPINQMRNLARLQARTELVGLMDVDMLVSSKLAKALLLPRKAALMKDTCSQRTVYVVPAFETYGDDAATLADQLVRQAKPRLMRSIGAGVIAPFDSKRFAIGHNTTDFKRWYNTSTQYKVDYTARYEPWVIANRLDVPWHDVRFRGYGQNKIVQIAHTNASGFSFVVHPTGFIIHRAHAETKARQQLVQDMKRNYILQKKSKTSVGSDTVYGHSKKVWDDAKEKMDLGVYDPVLDAATKHCRDVLPWWQQHQQEQQQQQQQQQG